MPEHLIIDAARIKQVLMNLLSNSLKFTFEGWIKIEASYSSETSHLYFIVSDTGVGLLESEREKLFTLFGKLKATNSINT